MHLINSHFARIISIFVSLLDLWQKENLMVNLAVLKLSSCKEESYHGSRRSFTKKKKVFQQLVSDWLAYLTYSHQSKTAAARLM